MKYIKTAPIKINSRKSSEVDLKQCLGLLPDKP